MSDQEQSSPSTDQPPSEASSSTASPSKQVKDKDKIDVLLKATGDAPIMKKKKWAVERTKTMGGIAEFIRKYLKYSSSDSLFIYINQSFSPAPDVVVGTLYDCFGSDGKLILHYCKSQAWG